MRIKFYTIIFVLTVFTTTALLIYQLVSIPAEVKNNGGLKSENIALIESRLHKIEDEISSNHDTITEIRQLINGLSQKSNIPSLKEGSLNVNKFQRNLDFLSVSFNLTKSVVQPEDCLLCQAELPPVDYQMKDVFDVIPFDNPDGGAWKQGWEISYDEAQWSSDKKLKIFVVPHSHNDPGWLRTFEGYFEAQTVHIFDNMVNKLAEDPRRKFIWAEISYFSLWWERQTKITKEKMKKLVESGQLEIVTGGWVMPDEANTHYYSIVNQLMTGHEWVQMNFDVKPQNGWAIDPFGMSPTMAYILKKAGLQNMVIQRTHYSLKKYFAQKKSLEFRWRQIWDTESKTDMLCHMMPFYSYDVPHTCGPDPKVCCQFDFRRLPGSNMHCPWRIPPKPIDSTNVEARANLLLDQYRKKAQLYKTNVLLVQLGDDFRYDKESEWDNQFLNYQKLFNFMNSKTEWNVQAQFGTLSDYFRALREENEKLSGDEELSLPSLSGDFFSYSDRDDHYWTGYFTTRPFYKRMDRILQSYLRTAELFFSLMLEAESLGGISKHDIIYSLMHELTIAQRELGLFQHHDGITGTAKQFVVVDYAKRLLKAIKYCQHIIEEASASILHKSSMKNLNEDSIFTSDEEFSTHDSLASKKVLEISQDSPKWIYVLNPDAHRRQQQISALVSTPLIEVRDGTGEAVLCQVDPVFTQEGDLESNKFEVTFIINVSPLSFTAFSLHAVDSSSVNHRFTAFSDVLVRNKKGLLHSEYFSITDETPQSFTLNMKNVKADFNEQGLLSSVNVHSYKLETRLKFVSYYTRGSGAYLFMPRGNYTVMRIIDGYHVITKGPLKSSVNLFLPLLRHQITLRNSPGIDGLGISIDNYVNIQKKQDFELAMQIFSNIQNGNTFFTDLNGFQVIKRTRYAKIPLQGNFYPINSQIFIEDAKSRMSILTAQPLGGSSTSQGQVEIMLDRILTQDDERGLGEGIRDNVLAKNSFTLLIESSVNSEEFSSNYHKPGGFPSLASHFTLSRLLTPVHILHLNKNEDNIARHWSVGGELPCDIKLVGLRVLQSPGQPGAPHPPSSRVSLILHRVGFTCAYSTFGHVCETSSGKIKLTDLFPASFADDVKQMSLTHLYEGITISKSYQLSLKPMELSAYQFTLSRPL